MDLNIMHNSTKKTTDTSNTKDTSNTTNTTITNNEFNKKELSSKVSTKQRTKFTDAFSQEIYEQTYRYGNETIDETHNRVACDLAKIEKDSQYWAEKFRNILQDFKFVPGGRITSNAGTNLKGTSYINCVVSGPEGSNQDSMEGILGELNRQARILKSEQGYGVCANFMRPRGAFIHGIGNTSPGAVKMLEMWDTQSAVITEGSGMKSKKKNAKQKIRKGAQMVTMSCWHPDVLEFITAKQTPGRLTKFNMSVLITDSFMEAVEKHKSWNLEYPNYEKHSKEYNDTWDGDLESWKKKGLSTEIYKSFEDANELWNVIMTSTYNRNEPGVLFVDTMNRLNNLYYCEHINATNPCLTGDTMIQTNESEFTELKNLVGKQFNAYIHGKSYPSTEKGFWSTGEKQVYKIYFEDSNEIWHKIRATDNHRFMTQHGFKTVSDLLLSLDSDGNLTPDACPEDSNSYSLQSGFNKNEYFKLVKIEKGNIEEVYDCTIPEVHCFNANGLVSHNCGEQILPKGGVCLLGSLNLTQFINADYNGKNDIWNYTKLKETIPVAIRFMDNVNDVSLVPLEEQRWNMKNKRRIGLGILGYASALLMCKIRYGSEKALEQTERLMKFISNEAYTASANLAKEKGAFPLFDAEKYLNGNFVTVLSKETRDLIKKNGIRNSHLLSIQPTGNSSIYANNVSGGLEPIFMPEYTRTSMMPYPPEGLHLPKNIDWSSKKADYPKSQKWEWVSEGDESLLSTEFNGYIWKMDKARGLLRETSVRDYGVRHLSEKGEWDPLADFSATTTQLSVDEHIDTMRIFAKYIDSAQSKTLNIPNEYPYADFKNVYMKAFKTGIVKGFTTYRAGTMTSVLSASKKPKRISRSKAPNRPEELECDINIVKAGKKRYIVIVGLLDSQPYEVFAFLEKDIKFSDSLNKGFLIKEKVKRNKKDYNQYNLKTDYFTINDLQSYFEAPEQESLSRMISVGLKHGCDIAEIYRQLQKAHGNITSFSKAIARTLTKYIKEWKETECDSCGDPEGLVFQEGCLICKNCAYSKCL